MSDKNNKVEESGSTLKIVRGETLTSVASERAPVPAHTHQFRYEVVQSPDGATFRVIGVTDYDGASGSSHSITCSTRTDPADDGHYHVLPVDEPVTDRYTMAGGGDIAAEIVKMVTGEQAESIETVDRWAKLIMDEMESACMPAGHSEYKDGEAPNPLTNPKKGKKKSVAVVKKKESE